MADIKKLDLNDPDTKSADIVAGNIDALKALFPDAITEGKIDFEVLKGLLGAAVERHRNHARLNTLLHELRHRVQHHNRGARGEGAPV